MSYLRETVSETDHFETQLGRKPGRGYPAVFQVNVAFLNVYPTGI